MINGIIKYKEGAEESFTFKNWYSLQVMADNQKDEIRKINIFFPLKELDAEIRIVEVEQNEDKSFYFSVEIGMVESIGEQGYTYTLFYEDFPVLSEIDEDIINHYENQKKELNNKMLSAYEENHLEAINKINL